MAHDFVFRFILLGDSNVGKTSIALKFSQNAFPSRAISTICMDFYTKSVKTIDGMNVKLHVWDAPGIKRLRSTIRSSYKSISAILLVYDITSKKSFESLAEWIEEIRDYCENDDIILMLIGNKHDLESERQIDDDDAKQFMIDYNLHGFAEVSAFDGESIDDIFLYLATKIGRMIKNGAIFPSRNKGIYGSLLEVGPRQRTASQLSLTSSVDFSHNSKSESLEIRSPREPLPLKNFVRTGSKRLRNNSFSVKLDTMTTGMRKAGSLSNIVDRIRNMTGSIKKSNSKTDLSTENEEDSSAGGSENSSLTEDTHDISTQEPFTGHEDLFNIVTPDKYTREEHSLMSIMETKESDTESVSSSPSVEGKKSHFLRKFSSFRDINFLKRKNFRSLKKTEQESKVDLNWKDAEPAIGNESKIDFEKETQINLTALVDEDYGKNEFITVEKNQIIWDNPSRQPMFLLDFESKDDETVRTNTTMVYGNQPPHGGKTGQGSANTEEAETKLANHPADDTEYVDQESAKTFDAVNHANSYQNNVNDTNSSQLAELNYTSNDIEKKKDKTFDREFTVNVDNIFKPTSKNEESNNLNLDKSQNVLCQNTYSSIDSLTRKLKHQNFSENSTETSPSINSEIEHKKEYDQVLDENKSNELAVGCEMSETTLGPEIKLDLNESITSEDNFTNTQSIPPRQTATKEETIAAQPTPTTRLDGISTGYNCNPSRFNHTGWAASYYNPYKLPYKYPSMYQRHNYNPLTSFQFRQRRFDLTQRSSNLSSRASMSYSSPYPYCFLKTRSQGIGANPAHRNFYPTRTSAYLEGYEKAARYSLDLKRELRIDKPIQSQTKFSKTSSLR